MPVLLIGDRDHRRRTMRCSGTTGCLVVAHRRRRSDYRDQSGRGAADLNLVGRRRKGTASEHA